MTHDPGQYQRQVNPETGVTYFVDPEDQAAFQRWWMEDDRGLEMLAKWMSTIPTEGDLNSWSQITGLMKRDTKRRDFFLWLLNKSYFEVFNAEDAEFEALMDELENLNSDGNLHDLIIEVESRKEASLVLDTDETFPMSERLLQWLLDDPQTLASLQVEWDNLDSKPWVNLQQALLLGDRETEYQETIAEVPQDFSDFIHKGIVLFFFRFFYIGKLDTTKVKQIQPPRSKAKDPSEVVETWIRLQFKLPTIPSRERLMALSFCYPSYLINYSSS